MGKRCIYKALVVIAFEFGLWTVGQKQDTEEAYGETVHEMYAGSGETERLETNTDSMQSAEEHIQMTDMNQAFDVILQGATGEFLAGYRIDRSFLMRLVADYGEETVIRLAYCVLDGEMDVEKWYELTGKSIHVLWMDYCRDSGFQNEQPNVYRMDCSSPDETVISFTGDFNFADGWYTTEYMESCENGIYDCFSQELLDAMQTSDLLVMNNEFVYSDRGSALPGKAYTFRATPDKIELLSVFGADLVNLANNHTYDYGAEALTDTLNSLKEANLAYIGAGENIEEASKIVYYIANGRKIAIVSASEIERSTQYTREATANACGVLKTLHPERFLSLIRQADAVSDYVIVVPHWGTEGYLYPDFSQRSLAKQFVEAGADAVIGGHPHRLQGVGFIQGVPVAYSLGNFWFSEGTLYTTVAQVVIERDGTLRLKYLPCIQKDLTTSLITDTTEKDEFYHYLAAISGQIGIDADGVIYENTADGYPDVVIYDSEHSETPITGGLDNEGRKIDIVGNWKE